MNSNKFINLTKTNAISIEELGYKDHPINLQVSLIDNLKNKINHYKYDIKNWINTLESQKECLEKEHGSLNVILK
jgi:hypothetical protein